MAAAVLYEGYLLYPYRRSALKNRQRWPLGALYPRTWAEANFENWRLSTEVLVRGVAAKATAVLRWLEVRGAEAVEREQNVPAVIVEAIDDRFLRVRVEAENRQALAADAPRDAALEQTMISTHVLFGVTGGELISLLDPPEDARKAAARCANQGFWPVLVGGSDTMLSSPIILYDHPRIAPESPGDLFDAAEIDEILSLRILTLTDDERREACRDPRAKQLIERTERLTPEQLGNLHGVIRELKPSGQPLRPGDKVRLRPNKRADVFDIALAGKAATIEGVEQDLDGRVLFALTVDDDPGRDLGLFGHRYFFHADELEPLQ
ncbi:MAG TPA: hypothetical protein VH083_27980 [Myxococcales bacterium]|nr:hypothetical protein [Myxococcales bacterium]